MSYMSRLVSEGRGRGARWALSFVSYRIVLAYNFGYSAPARDGV